MDEFLLDVSGNDLIVDPDLSSADLLSVPEGDIEQSSGTDDPVFFDRSISSGDSDVLGFGGVSDQQIVTQVVLEDNAEVIDLLQSIDSRLSVLEDDSEISVLIQSIDSKFSLALGLALFVFCFQRIRSAVRGFTGRGVI